MLQRIQNARGKIRVTSSQSPKSFRFADHTYKSLGVAFFLLETPPGVPAIEVPMDIVPANIPPLLGMDIMDANSLYPNTVANRLTKCVETRDTHGNTTFLDQWFVPMQRSHSRHSYAKMAFPAVYFFTKAQLVKMHRNFHHPSVEKLFNLLQRARPETATKQTWLTLQDIAKRCDPCQRITNAPNRFRVSFGAEHVRFNERIMMDVMYIDGKAVLHIVDEGTRFSAARFLPDNRTATIWKLLLVCWANIYTGLPNRIITDQGSNFGKFFVHICEQNNVQAEKTGVEAHNSLGLGERYHQPLRSTFRKLKIDYPVLPDDIALSVSVKTLNDTLGPEGIVPTVLVFGDYPRLYTLSEELPSRLTNEQRAALVTTARKEMEKHMAELRLRRSLKHNPPPATDYILKPGDEVLVWREKLVEHRIGEFIGPFLVDSVDHATKTIFIRDSKVGAARPFNISQVKLYHRPENISFSFISDLCRPFTYFSSPDDADEIFATEVVQPKDPRATSSEMLAARQAEIKNLLKRGTFKVVLTEDVPKDANVLPGRFVLAIKSTIDNKTKYKARYVIGGHRDKLKDFMVHSAQVLQPASIRLLLAIAQIKHFQVWSSDVKHAYIQSDSDISRDIFIKKVVPEFELQPNECLKLLKPLYGLCESGDLWHQTFSDHHQKELGMKPMRSDQALFVWIHDQDLQGLSGCYVDDILRTGNQNFAIHANQTRKRFEMAEDEHLPCTFTGFVISKTASGDYIIDQHDYLRKLESLASNGSYAQFRSMRQKLGWLANSRPDCLFEVSQLAQVTDQAFDKNPATYILRINRATAYAINNHTTLHIPPLDIDTLKVIGFSDGSFANNADLTSQLGYIIFLGDNTGRVAPIQFKSYKAKRVTRSAMASEVIAFSDMSDYAITLAMELNSLLNKNIPVHLLTDSKCLFDVIAKNSKTSEKRTMLDIASVREAVREKVISDIGFVRSSRNIADGLTKNMSQKQLFTVLRSGFLELQIEQWIIRN